MIRSRRVNPKEEPFWGAGWESHRGKSKKPHILFIDNWFWGEKNNIYEENDATNF